MSLMGVSLLTFSSLSPCANFKTLPCDVLVSTPLRLDYVLYWMSQSRIDLSSVEYLVLDESDKLFELGFVEQIDSVVNACSNPQIVRSLFSATLPDAVEELARSIMHDAVRIVVGEKNSASQSVKQKLVFVGSEEGKILALRQSFQESLHPPVLVFAQSKERAKELYKELAFEDFKADCIHADLTQAQRELAVDVLKSSAEMSLMCSIILTCQGITFQVPYLHPLKRCRRSLGPISPSITSLGSSLIKASLRHLILALSLEMQAFVGCSLCLVAHLSPPERSIDESKVKERERERRSLCNAMCKAYMFIKERERERERERGCLKLYERERENVDV